MNLALQADLLVRRLIFFLTFREAAMALNSLYPDGWFALGAAALKVSYFIFSNSLVAICFHSNVIRLTTLTFLSCWLRGILI